MKIIEEETKNSSALLGTKSFLITSSLYEQQAHLTVLDLKEAQFSIGGRIVPEGLSYEVLGNKWYKFNWRVDSPNKVARVCLPNSIGSTEAGVPIYSFGEGDAGYGTLSYIVVDRNSTALDFRGNIFLTPILLQMSISSDPSTNSDSHQKFNAEILNLIESINFPVADYRT